MSNEKLSAVEGISSSLQMNQSPADTMEIVGRYTLTCIGADGMVKWSEDFDNMVVYQGKNDMLDKYFQGSAYTAASYMGLIGALSTGITINDTMASHAWTESTVYSNATRIASAWNGASSGSKSMSSARTFNINASDTINGALISTDSTKGGTTGVLFSAGTFSPARAVASGDTLNINYTVSL